MNNELKQEINEGIKLTLSDFSSQEGKFFIIYLLFTILGIFTTNKIIMSTSLILFIISYYLFIKKAKYLFLEKFSRNINYLTLGFLTIITIIYLFAISGNYKITLWGLISFFILIMIILIGAYVNPLIKKEKKLPLWLILSSYVIISVLTISLFSFIISIGGEEAIVSINNNINLPNEILYTVGAYYFSLNPNIRPNSNISEIITITIYIFSTIIHVIILSLAISPKKENDSNKRKRTIKKRP